MIRFYTPADYGQVLLLWQEAFGDAKDAIDVCIKHFSPYLLLDADSDTVNGMLTLLPVQAEGQKGRYIYAVATAKRMRRKGVSTRLLDYAKSYIKAQGEQFLVLVPATKALFSFYAKRGFVPGACVRKTRRTYKAGSEKVLKIEHISPRRLLHLRKAYFAAQPFAAWSEKLLKAIFEIYKGNFYKLTGKNGFAFLVCCPLEDKLYVPELCMQNTDEDAVFSTLFSQFNCTEIHAVLPDKNGKPLAMFYPPQSADTYFNLAID